MTLFEALKIAQDRGYNICYYDSEFKDLAEIGRLRKGTLFISLYRSTNEVRFHFVGIDKDNNIEISDVIMGRI